jgi:hypothetical protein
MDAAGNVGMIANAQNAAAPISRKRFIWHFSLGAAVARRRLMPLFPGSSVQPNFVNPAPKSRPD